MLGKTGSADKLVSVLFGKAQQAVLGLLFGRPDESFYVREIVRATRVGQGAVQRELQRLAEAGIIIVVAFVFGSFASGEPRKTSDVDILVVGDATFGEIVSALSAAQEKLVRDVNPSVYPVAEFRQKLAGAGHHFLTSVLKGPKIFLVGNERELTGLAEKRLADRTQAKPTRNKRPARRRRS
jgi:predicted nucleotidyltransferase